MIPLDLNFFFSLLSLAKSLARSEEANALFKQQLQHTFERVAIQETEIDRLRDCLLAAKADVGGIKEK